jgi:hypothetical protein
MDETPGSLRRVIAVGQAVDLEAGGTLYVTAIEVWDRALILHSAEQLPESLPPGEPIEPSRPLWIISDDVGTAYVPRGGGSGGSQSHRRSTFEFLATVPSTATTLLIVGPGMRDDEPMRVHLSS